MKVYTKEQIAQWVIDNRYNTTDGSDRMTDTEMFNILVDLIQVAIDSFSLKKEPMKTKVEITALYEHAMFNIGDVGYIDGHVRCANEKPYVVVIVGANIDYVPFHCLKVIL